MMNRNEDVAYARDQRNRRARTDFVIEMPNGTEIQLPTRYVVCSCCRGEGRTVNPAIDSNGLSAEDFAEDPDFAEDYGSGVYDVTCGPCEGQRVVKAVDWDRVPADVAAVAERQAADEARDFEEHLAEIRMGC